MIRRSRRIVGSDYMGAFFRGFAGGFNILYKAQIYLRNVMVGITTHYTNTILYILRINK